MVLEWHILLEWMIWGYPHFLETLHVITYGPQLPQIRGKDWTKLKEFSMTNGYVGYDWYDLSRDFYTTNCHLCVSNLNSAKSQLPSTWAEAGGGLPPWSSCSSLSPGSVHHIWGILGGTRVIGVIARHHWHRSAFTSKALTNFLCSCPCTAAARGKPAQIQENQMKAISRHVPVKMSYQSNKFCAMCSWSCQVLGEPEVAEPNLAPCPWPSIGSLPEMDKARFFCTKASHGFLDIWIMVLNGSISGDMNGYEWLLLTING